MAGRPTSQDDFSRRVQDAMSRAQRGAQQPGAGAPRAVGMDAGQVVSSDQLNAAMAQQTAGRSTSTAPARAAGASQSAPGGQETVESTGPLGDGDWLVRDGDCVSLIAKRTGHFWATIWDDSRNSELRDARVQPNVLLPGDRVWVPELRRKEEAAAYEQRSRFRRLGEPSKLRIRIMAGAVAPAEETDLATSGGAPPAEATAEAPLASAPYILTIDGENTSGATDADGYVELPISGSARAGMLVLEPGTIRERAIPVRLGRLSPISEIEGVAERLSNLGFPCNTHARELTRDLSYALRNFQRRAGLPQTGEPDSATRAALQEAHGS